MTDSLRSSARVEEDLRVSLIYDLQTALHEGGIRFLPVSEKQIGILRSHAAAVSEASHHTDEPRA
jgi:hypothetical protein